MFVSRRFRHRGSEMGAPQSCRFCERENKACLRFCYRDRIRKELEGVSLIVYFWVRSAALQIIRCCSCWIPSKDIHVLWLSLPKTTCSHSYRLWWCCTAVWCVRPYLTNSCCPSNVVISVLKIWFKHHRSSQNLADSLRALILWRLVPETSSQLVQMSIMFCTKLIS